MRHNTERGDMRVVRDEMEKKRGERSRSLHSREAESLQRRLYFLEESQYNCWGQHSDTVSMCTEPFTTH